MHIWHYPGQHTPRFSAGEAPGKPILVAVRENLRAAR
jgi:hypothetical protein